MGKSSHGGGCSAARRGRERASTTAGNGQVTKTPIGGRKRARGVASQPAPLHDEQRRRRTSAKMAVLQRTSDGRKPPPTQDRFKPRKASKWQEPDIEFGYASDGERARRVKKPRNAYQQRTDPAQAVEEMQRKMVFAVAPTRKSKSLNRKKLSKKDKIRLAVERKRGGGSVANAFTRGSSASVRKLLTLELTSSDLEADLAEFARFVSLTDEERAFRKRVFEEIKSMVREVFPAAHVELYGSSSSGLETFRSDLDITVGNVDGLLPPAPVNVNEDEDDEDYEDERVVAGAVFDTVGELQFEDASEEDESIETSFSLNLSLPGMTTNLLSTPRSSSGKPRMAASAPHKSPWNPTLRRQKMRQLRALQQILMDNRPQYKIKCLSKAKIPILMVEDKDTGLQIDIGVNREAFQSSDHGRTTTLVTELQLALGKPFISIVVFLKEFLHQFDLDKPFTGGLGSYRLYMMVAYIFTTRFQPPNPNKRKHQSQSAGASVSSAKALMTFLEVFSNRHKSGFFSSSTELPVRHGSLMDVVDFHAVFRLDDCVDKFAMALDIITKQRNLGCVVYEETLQTERRDSAKRILQHLEKEERQRKEEEAKERAALVSESDDSDVEYYL